MRWCAVFKDACWKTVSPAASPALQLSPCHADPTGTHAVVPSRTEIPVAGLVSGSWMPESSCYGAAAGMHISGPAAGVQQLACSGWLKGAQCGISLLATRFQAQATLLLICVCVHCSFAPTSTRPGNFSLAEEGVGILEESISFPLTGKQSLGHVKTMFSLFGPPRVIGGKSYTTQGSLFNTLLVWLR